MVNLQFVFAALVPFIGVHELHCGQFRRISNVLQLEHGHSLDLQVCDVG